VQLLSVRGVHLLRPCELAPESAVLLCGRWSFNGMVLVMSEGSKRGANEKRR